MVGGRDVFAENAEDVPDVTEAAVDAAVKARRIGRRRRAAAAGAEKVRARAPRRRGRPPRRGCLPHVFTLRLVASSISPHPAARHPYGFCYLVLTWHRGMVALTAY